MAAIDNVDILARTLYGEAKANDKQDATAIAAVIMNRVNLPLWPDSAAEVCLQPKQFSCWNENDPNRARILKASGKWFAECKNIARIAVDNMLADSTERSTHYHTRAVKPRWSKGKKAVYFTEGHLFFNNIDTKPPQNAKEALDQEKPLASTKTAKSITVASGVAGTAAIAGETLQHVAPALPIVQSLTESMPWFIAAVFGIGMAYLMYLRFIDRKNGVR